VEAIKVIGGILKELVNAFAADQVPFMAAAVSYFAFFSLFPLLLGLIAVAGFVLAPEEASQRVLDFSQQGFPGQEEFLRQTLRSVVESRGPVGLFALALLLWTGKNVFVSLAQALDLIFKTPAPGGLGFAVKRNLVALLFAAATGGVMAVVSVLYGLLFAVFAFEIPLLGIQPQDIPGILPLFLNLLPVLLVMLSLVAMYRWLPVRRLPFPAIASAALATSVLWEISRRLFTWYLATFSRFNEVYGPVASVIVFLFWLYLSAIIFLLGAEAAQLFARLTADPDARET